ncbi:MAG: serpin family protein, partial [Limisphaerales bacterium]
GAAGKTRTEIQKALNTTGFSQDDINRFFEELNGSLLSQSNVALDLANSIWVDKGFDLKAGFVSTNESVFGAMLGSVNFETPESADTINRWSSDSTRGKINRIVSFPFPAKTEVILANAIYFKGKWATPFDKRLTKARYFYLAGGIIKQAPMMSRRGSFQYEAGDGFQAVELPYAGDRMQMILFLPPTNSSPAQLLAAFNGKNRRDNVLRHFLTRNGTVIFPKFKLNCQLLLNDPLERLGMTDAFIPGAANFSGMSADPLFVSEVLQKAFVAVNEQGTEAAAVTAVSVRATAMLRPLKPFEMVLDRPFVFMISDKPTGAILFMGIVNDPTAR